MREGAVRLPAQLVDGFDDSQLNFEKLQDVLTTPGSQLPFLQLTAAGGRKVAFGTVTLTFTASAVSGIATVTHGLGTTPVVAGCLGGQTGVAAVAFAVGNYTSTTFQVQAQAFASFTGTVVCPWIAIG